MKKIIDFIVNFIKTFHISISIIIAALIIGHYIMRANAALRSTIFMFH